MPNSKKRLLITAGPTREMLDPVRFLSNLSTGEMGYTLAKVAAKRGYQVTLISGPTSLEVPNAECLRFISITNASQLQKVAEREFKKHDILVMTAAVCDFTAKFPSRQKIQRTKTTRLELQQTPDIVAGLAKKKGKRIVIGFCLETQDWIKRAQAKRVRKGLDGIVANYYTSKHIPFGNRRLNTAFIDDQIKELKNLNKQQISERLIEWVELILLKTAKN